MQVILSIRFISAMSKTASLHVLSMISDGTTLTYIGHLIKAKSSISIHEVAFQFSICHTELAN